MKCLRGSRADREYDSGYPSTRSFRFPSASSSRSSSCSSQSSNRSAVPSQFKAKPSPYTRPSPHGKLSLHDGSSKDFIPLENFGNRIHLVNSAHPGSFTGYAEIFVKDFFEESQHQIRTMDDLNRCFTYKYNGNNLPVAEDRIK